MSTAIILGTARNGGNTHQLALRVAQHIAPAGSARLFDLADYDIDAYDYKHHNSDDDFLPLMDEIIGYDHIVLASPIYWYSPSSVMKVFLDRWSDLLTIEKEMGRRLRQKSGAVISTGANAELTPCFEDIFRLTYEYLGMSYKGMLYCACDEEIQLDLHHSAIDQFTRNFHADGTTGRVLLAADCV
ncbi:flavodoxin family protein [Undibacterium terreum]|uniref:Flavodoxin n=1 Tax=Undibacterium terreum TaxID=1224302 RepID=A0A916UCM8_9BURK|nr:NAD(P)H-dependent oxidoreductase [Undibacterium terreum]GGC66139.1 flavodoxin [Undibacterium terreum]